MNSKVNQIGALGQNHGLQKEILDGAQNSEEVGIAGSENGGFRKEVNSRLEKVEKALGEKKDFYRKKLLKIQEAQLTNDKYYKGQIQRLNQFLGEVDKKSLLKKKFFVQNQELGDAPKGFGVKDSLKVEETVEVTKLTMSKDRKEAVAVSMKKKKSRDHQVASKQQMRAAAINHNQNRPPPNGNPYTDRVSTERILTQSEEMKLQNHGSSRNLPSGMSSSNTGSKLQFKVSAKRGDGVAQRAAAVAEAN